MNRRECGLLKGEAVSCVGAHPAAGAALPSARGRVTVERFSWQRQIDLRRAPSTFQVRQFHLRNACVTFHQGEAAA